MKTNQISYTQPDSIFDLVPQGLVFLDLEGRLITFNESAKAIFDFDTNHSKGKLLKELVVFVCPNIQREIEPDSIPFFNTSFIGTTSEDFIMGVKKIDETTYWYSVSSKACVYQENEVRLLSFTDVSELVTQTQSFKDKQEHLQLLVASIDDIIFEVDASGQILNCWTNHSEQLFFPISQLINKNLAELFPKSISDNFIKVISKAYLTKKTQHIDYPSPFSSKTDTWYRLQARPIHALEGKVAVIISDITEIRRTRENLRDLDLRWKFVLDNSDQLLCDWDMKAMQVSLSGKLTDVLGLKKSLVPVNDLKKYIHHDDLLAFVNQCRECQDGKKEHFEFNYRVIQNDGVIRWISSKAVIAEWSPEGQPSRILGIGTDVTDWMNVLEKVRLNEEKFNSAFQYSGTGMALVRMDGTCMNVNKTLCRMLGYTPEEMTSISFSDFTHPEDLAIDQKNMEKLKRKETETYAREKRYLHKSGLYLWCSLSVSVVLGQDKEPMFCIAQIQDISQLRMQIDILERHKIERELAMSQLNNNLRQMEEFNQIVAHNLKGPAANIEMLVDLIQETESQSDKAEYLNYLKLSSSEFINTLEELIDILEVTEIPYVESDDCHFQEIIDKVANQHISEIVVKSADIVTNWGVKNISYPRIYLESILSNLLSNSLKYSFPDRPIKIRLETKSVEGKLCLTFEDNGIGIDLAKYSNHIFKFKKTFHPGYESRGIGLFMIRQQIERMGGSIVVDSQPGVGTIFTVLLDNKHIK